VFFFDEAHLLFDDAPAALIDKVEQVVRLIRSKGVGVYFVTQNPLDVPEKVLGQLGNRVQHALRAFTPRDQKAVKSAAETMRANPTFDAAAAITELGVGEALVSFLDEKGRPQIVERAFVVAPSSRLGPLTPPERQAAIQSSVLFGHYEKLIDRESAHEKLMARNTTSEPEKVGAGGTAASGGLNDLLFGRTGPRGGQTDGLLQTVAKGVARTVSSQIGRALVRGVLGSLLGGSSKR
jgi:DNA helicase HerA-like ATPase